MVIKLKKVKFKITFFSILLLIITLVVLGLNTNLKTTFYEVQSDKVNSPVKIAFISDFHSCYYGEDQKILLNAIDAQNPDVVLYGGDIFDDRQPYDNAIALLKAMQNKYPAYYVTGNHEYRNGEADILKDIVRSYNIKVLENEQDTININGEIINIFGANDPDSNIYISPVQYFQQQLEVVKYINDNGNFTILLTHRPELFSTYKDYPVDLALAGHAHGGQWRIPWILNGVYSPNQGFFPKYPGGKYEHDDTTMIVSTGLSNRMFLVPRIYNPPEIVIINIK